ncbi:MAG: TetR/AcrR family transcriptional regulator [Acholeplasma sp.]|nr:TetR/AcrR family transcriptional regulator [Acholeplasma sp.]
MSVTKDKLIAVVIEHIKAGSNLNEISLSKIANEAEIGKSTVYEHFSSKEDMISSTYAYLLKQYRFILLEEVPRESFELAFKTQIKRILYVMREAKHLMDAIMKNTSEIVPHLMPEHQCLMEEIQAQMTTRFESIFAMYQLENTLKESDFNPYSKHIIQALISGLMVQYVQETLVIDEEPLCDLLLEQVVKAITK